MSRRLRIAVVHNLARGGARRRLAEQVRRMDADVLEVCLGTAVPVTATALVVPFALRAPEVPRALRAPLRHADLAALALAWRRVGVLVAAQRADVLYANPCRFLQAPAVLRQRDLPPAVYFCDEPRRVDHEPQAAATRNPRTRAAYAGLYAAERHLDATAVARAQVLLTNSRHSAGAIRAAYGREAAVVPMGVPDDLLAPLAAPTAPRHVLSVGMLTPGKGHDLVLDAVAAAGGSLPVLVISPRAAAAEEARLRERAARLGVGLEVRVGVSDAALAAAYDDAHATLYLARAEPLGLASLEAQARGCPVIVADEGGLPETVVPDRTAFVVRRDAAAAAAALRRLEDPAMRAEMAAAARAHGAGQTWQRSSDVVLDHLAAVAAAGLQEARAA